VAWLQLAWHCSEVSARNSVLRGFCYVHQVAGSCCKLALDVWLKPFCSSLARVLCHGSLHSRCNAPPVFVHLSCNVCDFHPAYRHTLHKNSAAERCPVGIDFYLGANVANSFDLAIQQPKLLKVMKKRTGQAKVFRSNTHPAAAVWSLGLCVATGAYSKGSVAPPVHQALSLICVFMHSVHDIQHDHIQTLS